MALTLWNEAPAGTAPWTAAWIPPGKIFSRKPCLWSWFYPFGLCVLEGLGKWHLWGLCGAQPSALRLPFPRCLSLSYTQKILDKCTTGASSLVLLHPWTSRLEDLGALWPPGFGVGSLSPGMWHWELGEAAGS